MPFICLISLRLILTPIPFSHLYTFPLSIFFKKYSSEPLNSPHGFSISSISFQFSLSHHTLSLLFHVKIKPYDVSLHPLSFLSFLFLCRISPILPHIVSSSLFINTISFMALFNSLNLFSLKHSIFLNPFILFRGSRCAWARTDVCIC